MIESSAEFWSAVAAVFAALTSFLAYRIQRRDYYEAAKPELVLDGWSRDPPGSGLPNSDTIRIKSIRNVGNGPALHVYINAASSLPIDGNVCSLAFASTVRIAIIPAGNDHRLDSEISLHWSPAKQAFTHISLPIVMHCWDTRGHRHTTKYNLLVVPLRSNTLAADPIAPGVVLTNRTVESVAVWRLKLKKHVQRFPKACSPWFMRLKDNVPIRLPEPLQSRWAKFWQRLDKF